MTKLRKYPPILPLVVYVVIIVQTCNSLAFSPVHGKGRAHSLPVQQQRTQLAGTQNVYQLFDRRGTIGAILSFGGILLSPSYAFAADDCQTNCMYKCAPCQSANDPKNDKKGDDKNLIEREEAKYNCLAQCKGTLQCIDEPPKRKREPQLIRAQVIRGLYPRWQDEFL